MTAHRGNEAPWVSPGTGFPRIAVLLTLLASESTSQAVRPFITDDARVVGLRQAQVESWVRLDEASFEHWVLAAFGPMGPLELSIGAMHGATWSAPGSEEEEAAHYTLQGPLLQAKLLLLEPKENRWPGVALAGGTLIPLSIGKDTSEGWGSFAYVALTESLFSNERLFLHGNLGFFFASAGKPPGKGVEMIWGLGMQLKTFAGLHVVAEFFSGDPYESAGSGAAQGGLRYIFNNWIQLDATVGKGIWGSPAMPVWGTAGLRVVGDSWR